MVEKTIQIAERTIGAGTPCFIIAEIGINHGGDERLCAEMIDTAAAAGADAVKLQSVTPEESYHPDTESYRIFSGATLSREAHKRLMLHAKAKKIILFSTPGDPSALRMLAELEMPAIKISSGLLTNLPLIALAAAGGKPLIMSTGMARMEEVCDAVRVARAAGGRDLALLQCTSLYPAPPETLNLRAMAALQDIGQCPVGYSDHHPAFEACVAAVACGASVIEKHFTLDVSMAGADHAISLEPGDFAAMVRAIRNVEKMLGATDKRPAEAELPLRDGRHRRLVAARDIAAGHLITSSDLYLMRIPIDSAALAARQLEEVVGRRTTRPIPRLTSLTLDMIEGPT